MRAGFHVLMNTYFRLDLETLPGKLQHRLLGFCQFNLGAFWRHRGKQSDVGEWKA